MFSWGDFTLFQPLLKSSFAARWNQCLIHKADLGKFLIKGGLRHTADIRVPILRAKYKHRYMIIFADLESICAVNNLCFTESMRFTILQMDEAYHWLCLQRKHFPPDADIWSFRYRYSVIKSDLLWEINSGGYRFSPQQKIIKSSGQVIHLWGSQDVLVMKLIANSVQASLQLSYRCTHVKGHGGLKHTIADVHNHLNRYQYVCKTDIRGFR